MQAAFKGPISIHALLAESDWMSPGGFWAKINFYPRSPCGERPSPAVIKNRTAFSDFYPRSPCGERLSNALSVCCRPGFLSTLSLRRATAPRRGTGACHRDFYPRSPCGERLHKAPYTNFHDIFLSTLSLRRATMQIGIMSGSILNFYPRSPCGERPL